MDSVFGLPVHALVVHAVVVLVPIAALAAVAFTVVPRWRGPYAAPAALAAIGAAVSTFIAEDSGEELEEQVRSPADAREQGLIGAHAELGDRLLPWVVLLTVGLVAVAALALLRRRGRPLPRLADWGALAVALVGAGLAVYFVVRIGHSGSSAVWSDLPTEN